MPKVSRIAAVVFYFALVLPLLQTATARGGGFSGWGPYKLGMTLKQALAVPETTVYAKEPSCPRQLRLRSACPPIEYWYLRSASSETIGGSEFGVQLMFRKERLGRIELNYGTSNAAGDCERRFEDVLVDLEQRHGSLSAGVSQVPRQVKPASSNVQLGSSHYAHWTWDGSNHEFLFAGSMTRLNAWSAQKLIGSHRLEVNARHELNYRSSDNASESEVEKRLGSCWIRVRILPSSEVSTRHAPADLANGKAD